MPPEPTQVPPDDAARIGRILESIDDLTDLVENCTRETLDTDKRTRRAVLHALIEIGEGASRLSDRTRNLCPDIPWPQITHMRNVLVHVYRGINLDKVWDAATIHAPDLAQRLRALIQQEGESENG